MRNSAGAAYGFNPAAAGLITLNTWFQNICCWDSAWNYNAKGQAYDNAGNQNFGATGTALGFSPSTLLIAAGLKKTFVDYLSKGKLNPYLFRPYMNAPAKTNAIQQGIQYVNNGCTN
jgi:Bacterial toxin 44